MLADTRLAPSDFVAPIFVRSGNNARLPIKSMPGVYQFSVDTVLEELKRLQSLGIQAYILFGITDTEKKDPAGSHALNADNEVCRTLKAAKDAGVSMLAITDLCFCEYTSHGHCMVSTGPATSPKPQALNPSHPSVLSPQHFSNDATVIALGEQAVLHAECGADVVAPSGMMDHMVAGIRGALDAVGRTDTAILSYAVKYASAFYGPFREAAESPPQFGDRKGYQMDVRGAGGGAKEALREAALDVAEGADMIMVKPGVPYLDILRAVTDSVPVPTAAYHVSGEYAMLKAAAANGWIEEKSAVLETMHALKRAGASFILTYYAGALAEWLT